MPRALFVLLIAGLLSACTIERFHRDVGVTLDYARLSHGTTIHHQTRWQLPPGMRIGVAEVVPAKREAWLSAAQAGIDSVFTLSGVRDPGLETDLTLLVSWPRDRIEGATETGYVKYLRIDKLAVSDPLDVQLVLLDQRRDALIQTATLRLNPRLFASDPASAQHIQEAFASYAMGLIGGH